MNLRDLAYLAAVAEHRDHFGNTVTVLAIDRPHDVFTVTMTAEVEVGFPPPPAATPPWEAVRGALQAALAGAPSPGERVGVDLAATIAAAELALPSEGADATVEDDAALLALAAPCFAPGTPILDGARALARAIHDGFAFDPAATTVSTPVGTVLELRRGVCQDFAHVMIASLRRLGLAARYVSGYIRTHRSAGPDQRRRLQRRERGGVSAVRARRGAGVPADAGLRAGVDDRGRGGPPAAVPGGLR